jgi:hypothetical protein
MKSKQIEVRVDEKFLNSLGKVRDEYQNSPLFFNTIQEDVFNTSKAEELHYNWTDKVTILQGKESAFNFYTESLRVMSDTKFGYNDVFRPIMSNVLHGWSMSERPDIIDNMKNNLTSQQNKVINRILKQTPIIDKEGLLNEVFDAMLLTIKSSSRKIDSATSINTYFKSSNSQNMFSHPEINREDIDYYNSSIDVIPKKDARVLGSIIYNTKDRETPTQLKKIIQHPTRLSSTSKTNEVLQKAYKFE